VRFAAVFAFKYSPRPGTAAPRLDGEVSDAVASRRLQELFALQDVIQREVNSTLVGRTLEVLVTGWGKQPGTLSGRTPCHRVVHFAAEDCPGSPLGGLVPVRIDRALPHSLLGSLAAAS
jgi:tRNA-2-methylthio-N6-dimethylallyladenosine synthase